MKKISQAIVLKSILRMQFLISFYFQFSKTKKRRYREVFQIQFNGIIVNHDNYSFNVNINTKLDPNPWSVNWLFLWSGTRILDVRNLIWTRTRPWSVEPELHHIQTRMWNGNPTPYLVQQKLILNLWNM